MRAAAPVRIGVSSCLLGERVRHDGGDKRDAYLVETLGQLVEWVPVCPEAEVGLGTPHEPIRLVRDAGRHDGVRPVSRSGVRLTGRMRRFARDRLRALAKADLSGYILKKDSRAAAWSGSRSGPARTADRRNGTAAGSSRRSCCGSTRTCRWRKKDGCTIRRCARTSSSGSSPIGACGCSSLHAGTSAPSCSGTPRRSWR